jgi:hypothetical protein
LSSFDGTYYRLDAAVCEPASVQRPLPLLVAGAGERRAIPLAARFADAWHAWTTPEQFRHKSGLLDAACAAVGREPHDIRRLTGQVLLVVASTDTVDDESDIIGGAPFVTERLAAYQGAGVDEFIVRDHADTTIDSAIESVRTLASGVLPTLSSR